MIPYFCLALVFFAFLGKKPKKGFYVFCVLLILFSVLRNISVGADNIVYALNYRVISFDPNSWSAYTEMETAYCWLMAFCKMKLGLDYVDFMRFNALVYLVGTFVLVKRKSYNAYLSLFFFVFLVYYTDSFNIMRQYFALGLFCLTCALFFANGLRERKDVILYELIVILLAYGFHKSLLVLCLAPIFYMSSVKTFFGSKKNVVFILFFSYLMVFFPMILKSVLPYLMRNASFLGDRYVGYMSAGMFSEQKVSIFSALMNTGVVILVTLFMKENKKDYLPFYLVVIGAVFANIFGSLSALFLRISTNMMFFQILLLPYAWYNCSHAKLVRVIFVMYSIITFSNAIIKNFGKIVPYTLWGG